MKTEAFSRNVGKVFGVKLGIRELFFQKFPGQLIGLYLEE